MQVGQHQVVATTRGTTCQGTADTHLSKTPGRWPEAKGGADFSSAGKGFLTLQKEAFDAAQR